MAQSFSDFNDFLSKIKETAPDQNDLDQNSSSVDDASALGATALMAKKRMPTDDLRGYNNKKLQELLNQYEGNRGSYGSPEIETDEQTIRDQIGENFNSKRAQMRVEKMARDIHSGPKSKKTSGFDTSFLPPEEPFSPSIKAPTEEMGFDLSQKMPPAEETGFQLVPKDAYKLRSEFEKTPTMPDAKQLFHSEAAARNALEPIGNRAIANPEMGATLVGEPRSPIQLPQTRTAVGSPVSQNIGAQTAGISSGLPKVIPEVIGNPSPNVSSPASGLSPGIADAELIQPKLGVMDKIGNSRLGRTLSNPMMLELGLPLAMEYGPDVISAIKQEYKDFTRDPNQTDNVPTGTLVHGNDGLSMIVPNTIAKQEYPGFPSKYDVSSPDEPLPPGNIPLHLAAMPAPLMLNNDKQEDGSIGSPLATEDSAPSSKAEALLNAYRSIASDQKTGLADAQRRSNENEFYANLMRGVNLFNSGISGNKYTGPAKVNNEGLDALAKTANKPVEQYKQQVEDQKHDPSSRYSQMMREYLAPKLAEQGIDVNSPQFRNTPADVLEKIAPVAAAEAKNKLMAQYKNAVLDISKQRLESSQQNKQDRLDLTAQSRLQQVTNSAMRDPRVQANLKKIDAANRIFGTVGNYDINDEHDIDKIPVAELNKLPRLMVTELGQELNSLLANSNVTPSSTLAKILPKNFNMKATEWEDFVTSKLNPAQQADFAKLVLKAAARQRNIAEKNQNDQIGKYLDANQGLKKFLRDEDDYDIVRNTLGVRSRQSSEEQENKKVEPAKQQVTEIRRLDPKTGKTAIFDQNKKFLRFE